jgi:hypothetical protein
VAAGFADGTTEESGQIPAHHLLAHDLLLPRHVAIVEARGWWVIDDAVINDLIENTYIKLAKTSRGLSM